MIDVLIAGGGIAGSALAVGLSRMGLEVELVERACFPREKACGEGLMPAGVAALERLGVPISGAPFRGVRYHLGDETALGHFPPVGQVRAEGRGIRRRRLDAALFRKAAGCPGVRARSGVRVEGPLIGHGQVRGLMVEGTARRARLVVAADGANSLLRHKLGLDLPARTRRVGVRAHFRRAAGSQAPDCVEIFLGAGHELYVTPLPDGELLVALLGDPARLGKSAQATFDRAIRSQPALAAQLDGAEQITEPAGASPLAGRARARVLPGLVLLGDAAGFTDPITGGGMTQALLSAELLAAHLARRFPPDLAALERFDRERQWLLRDCRRLTGMLLWLTGRPGLTQRVFRLLARRPGWFSHLIGVSGGMRRLLPGTGAPV